MIKKSGKKYAVDIRPAGREGPRFRKSFASRAEAIAFERYVIGKHGNNEPWKKTTVKDTRRLSELAQQWYDLHGHQLKTGKKRLRDIEIVTELLKNPRGIDLTAKDFAAVRRERLLKVSRKTANHDLTNFKALFNELINLGAWHGDNPLAPIRKLKIDEQELTYLSHEQQEVLLTALDKHRDSHARITARVCLATGARWGEAATLTLSQVRDGQITFARTKSSKRRTLPINAELQALILDHAPLVDGYNTFKRTLETLGFNLPRGQMTHVLRHTFASRFMINGGNIITLQRALGHASLEMTMRYAHLAPDHLSEVLALNPLTS